MTARELAAALRARRASPVEAFDAFAERIERVNPALNAIVQLDLDRARRSARDLERASDRSMPLYGVPMTVKGSQRVGGLRVVVGNPLAPVRPSRRDGLTVMRLRAAGALIMGLTNTATDLADFQTDNPVFGRTNNPWDLRRTPGGSSGGAAAAVAARLTPIEVASDIAGSVRLPAAFTGVFGLKPTAGLIPHSGHVTEPIRHPRGGGIGTLASIGPLARDSDDVALVLGVLSGRYPRVRGLGEEARIEVATAIPGLRVSQATAQAIERLAATARRAGVPVNSFAWPVDPRVEHRTWTEVYQAAASYGAAWAFRRPGIASRVLSIRDAWGTALPTGTALLLPTVMCGPFTHRPTGTPIDVDGAPLPYWGLGRHTEPFNLNGFPALSLPAGLSDDGLPIGLQLVARPGQDWWLLRIAARLSRL